MRKKEIVVAFVVLLALPAVGVAQTNRFDFSVAAAGVLAKKSSATFTTITPTNSFGLLATARYRFSPKNSFALNYARTKDSQSYDTPPFSYRIQSTVTEYSGAYVFSPMETEKFEPFLFAGGGAMVFKPTNTFIDTFNVPVAAVRQTDVAFLYGAGVDYRVHSFIGLRLQYRGVVYKVPDFKFSAFENGSKGHFAEPSIGLVFKF